MGFKVSPRLFVNPKPALGFLLKQYLLSSLYIDDLYLQGISYEDCLHNVNITLKTSKKLGFDISKSVLVPIQELEHAGVVPNYIT